MAVKKSFDQSAKPAKQNKKSRKVLIWTSGTFVVLLGLLVMFYAPQATIHYGVCKIYLELNEPYPEQIKYLALDDLGDSVRVIYRKIDPFGSVSVNIATCTFRVEDGVVTPYLTAVDVNGKNKTYEMEKKEHVEAFNKSVPTIEAYPPDLTIPYFPLDDISEYRNLYDE